jgi:hypothetical protein
MNKKIYRIGQGIHTKDGKVCVASCSTVVPFNVELSHYYTALVSELLGNVTAQNIVVASTWVLSYMGLYPYESLIHLVEIFAANDELR